MFCNKLFLKSDAENHYFFNFYYVINEHLFSRTLLYKSNVQDVELYGEFESALWQIEMKINIKHFRVEKPLLFQFILV